VAFSSAVPVAFQLDMRRRPTGAGFLQVCVLLAREKKGIISDRRFTTSCTDSLAYTSGAGAGQDNRADVFPADVLNSLIQPLFLFSFLYFCRFHVHTSFLLDVLVVALSQATSL
jgi:hypothetical protein